MLAAVVLIVFNRPDVTRRVLAEIASARPDRLYVVADGARPDRAGEVEKVDEVRALFDQLDWPCTVHRNFAPANMGCCRRVVSGLDWVFEHEDAAIILEDDCVPAPAFFAYCNEMLDRYAADQRVFAVSGSNFARTEELPAHYFSNYSLMWGWATWRDRWSRYVVAPADADVVVRQTWRSASRRYYWRWIFKSLSQGAFDAWDYQWILTVWRHRALCCRPTMNLVENIGFGPDATHTVADGPLTGLPTYRGPASFARQLGPVAADRRRDRIDERAWLQLDAKRLVSMMLPGVVRAVRRFKSRQ